jgi:ABC-type glycerol-3-phosphate transport system substrate-binding protein
MKLRPFELAMVVIFGSLFILALILLSTFKPKVDEEVNYLSSGVTVWGTLPDVVFSNLFIELIESNEGFSGVSYKYIPPEDFDDRFVNALADQSGPDLVLISQDRLVKHRSRLQAIPYESFPIRDFRSLYIDGAEIFALNDGVYGFPILVDPIAMYWNRDIFSSNDLLNAPKTWEEVINETVPKLTVRDFNRNINRASIAMGEYGNIKNAFPILSLLLLQGGSVLVTEFDTQYRIRLDEAINNTNGTPFKNSVTFFTNFSNANNTLYSWNRSLRPDSEMFLSEDLALYFGFASEGKELAAKNPNLNFDITEVPQAQAATVKRTYGSFYSLIVPKTSKNKQGAAAVMQILSSPENVQKIADGYGMAPVNRVALAQGSNDIFGRITYSSAVYARGWLNPDLDGLNNVLSTMLEDIKSNRSPIGSSVDDAIIRIQQIY